MRAAAYRSVGARQEFRSAVLGHPSDLWKSLMQEPGSTPVDMEV